MAFTRFGLAVVAFVCTGTICGGGYGDFGMRRYVPLGSRRCWAATRAVGCGPMSPKAQKDWFRRKTWTDSDRQEFEATLGRARRPGRALCDYPDDVVERAPALHQKADCLWRLGDTRAAIEAYRDTFRAEETTRRVGTGAWLEFSMRVVREGMADLYREVEALLERRAQDPSSLTFPVQKYQFHLVP